MRESKGSSSAVPPRLRLGLNITFEAVQLHSFALRSLSAVYAIQLATHSIRFAFRRLPNAGEPYHRVGHPAKDRLWERLEQIKRRPI